MSNKKGKGHYSKVSASKSNKKKKSSPTQTVKIDRMSRLIKREQKKASEYLDSIKEGFLKKIEYYIKSGGLDREELEKSDDYIFVKVAFNLYGEQQSFTTDRFKKMKKNLKYF